MNDEKAERIIFGRTGGFTNIPEQYVLFLNGRLFKMEYDSLVKITRVNGKKVDAIETSLTGMDFANMEINDPGNMTYFIRVIKKDFQNEVRWADNDRYPQLKELYDSFMALVNE